MKRLSVTRPTPCDVLVGETLLRSALGKGARAVLLAALPDDMRKLSEQGVDPDRRILVGFPGLRALGKRRGLLDCAIAALGDLLGAFLAVGNDVPRLHEGLLAPAIFLVQGFVELCKGHRVGVLPVQRIFVA